MINLSHYNILLGLVAQKAVTVIAYSVDNYNFIDTISQ